MSNSKPAGDTSYVKGSTNLPSLINLTIGQALDATCRRLGLQDAAVFPDENLRLMFSQLKKEVDTLAAGLLAIGLSPGDHVMLWGANHCHLIVSIYACAKAGLVYSNLNHTYAPDVVKEHMKMVSLFLQISRGHMYGFRFLFIG